MEPRDTAYSPLILQIAPTALVLIGGAVGWFIKKRTEELREIEEKLREERRTIYGKILEPYIAIFAAKGQGAQDAVKQVLSKDYRKTSFDLMLVGSDEVVAAHNRWMQEAFRAEREGDQSGVKLLLMFGETLLEIRRSLGNRKTKLKSLDMLRGMIKDIDQQLEIRKLQK